MLLKLVWGLFLLKSLSECYCVSGVELASPNSLSKIPRDVLSRDTPNNYGDPIQGNSVTGTFCDIDKSVPARRDLWKAENVLVLAPRAPVVQQPLAELNSNSQAEFVEFMEKIEQGQKIPFMPSARQLQNWQITYRGANIPIGVTGVWYSFNNKPQDFVLEQLTGCTAIIAVSSQGIYAAHLWEGSSTVNAGSSHLKQYIDVNQQPKAGLRSEKEFQTVAVDIFGVATTAAQQAQREAWISIVDLQNQKKFQNGNDVEIFVLTKAKSTYTPEDPNVPQAVHGVIGIQYTPYDHIGADGCTPQARVRVFYENNMDPVVDKSWDSTNAQINSKMRRNACPVQNTATAAPTTSARPAQKTTTVPNPVTTETSTWTTNCQACTLVGGIADYATCTTVPECTPTQAQPTFAAWVSNRTIDIGDAEGKDNGMSLAQNTYKQLLSFCSGTSCDSTKYAKMDGVENVVADAAELLTPEMYFEEAVYSDQKTLERMLAAGLATWISASTKLCEEVEYEADINSRGSGCGNGPVKRADGKTFIPTSVVEKLEKRCEDCNPITKCSYKATICKAPDLITVVMSNNKGDPYANQISIGVNLASQGGIGQFLCELIADVLTAAALELAPELAPEDVGGDLEFQSYCGELGDLGFGGS